MLKYIDADGNVQMEVIIKDACSLAQGKQAWHLFTAACEFIPLLKFKGHQSVSIHHGVFDGAMKSALQRLIKAQHQAYHAYMAEQHPSEEWNTMSPLMVLFTCVTCAAHVGSNALKWGLAPYTIEEATKAIFICNSFCGMDSLRFLATFSFVP